MEERLAKLEARVKQLESYHGILHEKLFDDSFKEYPKAVGDSVVYSAEEEKELLAKSGG